MSKLAIRTIADIQQSARMPESGRIRLGQKGAKGQPQALSFMRFTSPHQDLIVHLAKLYGGTAKPWNEPLASVQGQFEVVTTSKEIRVVLASSDCYTQDYESWTRGGLTRRCDGETCSTTQDGPNGKEPCEVPCLCAQEGKLACKVKTRLNVIIPDIRFAGTWRLETSSEYAAVEIPGMVAVLNAIRRAGFTVAQLGLDQRKVVRNGETRRFVVPTLTLLATPEEITAGGAVLQGIPAVGAGNLPPLPALNPSPAPPADDDDIADGEIVDERDLSPEEEALRVRCFTQADKYIVSPEALWQGITAQAHDGKNPKPPLERILQAVLGMEEGKLEPLSFADGLVQWQVNK